MSVQNEIRRVRKTNIEHKAKRLRLDIESLSRTISINLDYNLKRPEDLPIGDIDSEWDELKDKWAELSVALAEIARLEEELN